MDLSLNISCSFSFGVKDIKYNFDINWNYTFRSLVWHTSKSYAACTFAFYELNLFWFSFNALFHLLDASHPHWLFCSSKLACLVRPRPWWLRDPSSWLPCSSVRLTASAISRHRNTKKYPNIPPEFQAHSPQFLYVSASLAFHDSQDQLFTPGE